MQAIFRLNLTLLTLLLLFTATVFPHNVVTSEGSAPFTIKWKSRVISLAISDSLFRENSGVKQGTDVRLALANSFLAWEDIIDIEFVTLDSKASNVSASSNIGDGVSLITIAPTNENTAIFSGKGDRSAATTRVFYNKLGEITEADIVLNPTQLFSDDGTFGSYDLQSTLTHELGHLLGFEHSSVLGSTMYENYGRNGLFGLINLYARTLSFSDIANARNIYPQTLNEFDCCKAIKGELDQKLYTRHKEVEFWIEDEIDGRVISQGKVDSKGLFDLASSSSNSERLYSRLIESGEYYPTKYIGKVSDLTDTIKISSVNTRKPTFTLEYIGINGQLSDTAVFLNPGRTYDIYVGGLGMNTELTEFKFSSPKIRILDGSLKKHDYGPDVSVVSITVEIASDINPGEFSLIAKLNGESHSMIGAVTIEKLVQPSVSLYISK